MLADASWYEEPEYDEKTGKPKEDTGPVLDFNDNSLALLESITKIKKT